MSTEASTYTFISEQSDDFVADEPWSIEKYADGLMDELFADLDRAVDVVSKQPIATIEPEYVRMSTVKIPANNPNQTETRPVRTQQINSQPQKISVSSSPVTRKTVIKTRRKSRNWFGQVVTWGAMVGIAVAGIIAVQNTGLLNRLTSRSLQLSIQPNVPSGSVEAVTQADLRANLADYMLNAMAAIERKQAKTLEQSGMARNFPTGSQTIPGNGQQTVAIASGSGTQLPQPMAANNTTPAAARSTTLVERIYIPVYKAPLPMRYAPPAIPGTGVGSPLPPIPKDAQPAKAVAQKPNINPTKTARNHQPINVLAAVRSTLKPIKVQNQPITLAQPKPPKISIAKFNAAPPPPQTAKPAPAQANRSTTTEVATAPVTASIILEGLLELGEKSAALFKVSGVTRRIEIGESISSTGWTLVDVANGEAIVRRNGEVRSIYTGQKF